MLFSIVGCSLEKQIEIEVPSPESDLVVIGFISPHEGGQVHISKVLSPFDASDSGLIPADVILSGNAGDMVKLRMDSMGIYRTPDSFEVVNNAVYSLSIDVEGFPPIFSEQVLVPDTIPILDLKWERQDQELATSNEIWIHLEWPKVKGSYGLKMEKSWVPFNTPSLENLGELMTDQNSLSTSNSILRATIISSRDTLMNVNLYNISSGLFGFLKSFANQSFNLEDVNSDPTFVNSNMNNSYGIFGAYTRSVRQIKF